MSNNRIVITVDGLAGSGKTKLAISLARKLGFCFLNSGIFYRGLAAWLLRSGVDIAQQDEVFQFIQSRYHENLDDGTAFIRVDANSALKNSLYIDNDVISEDLSDDIFGAGGSVIGKYDFIRKLLMQPQKNAFPGKNIVAEGRDMGTVVFPQSQLKFFITAPVEIRAQRRTEQHWLKVSHSQNNLTIKKTELYQKTLNDMKQRDQNDSQRLIAPTRPSDDAYIIDNGTQALTEVVENMYHIAQSMIEGA
jgi:CMP/dCMP kinase